MPLLLTIVLNAVNFAFFFLMALDITSSSRSSGIYSIMGGATPAAMALPKAGPANHRPQLSAIWRSRISPVQSLLLRPRTQELMSARRRSEFPVAEPRRRNEMHEPRCRWRLPGRTADSDPEAPSFLLGRVDVAYKFSPPIPHTVFNLFVYASPNCSASGGTVTCTFYRHIEMREMQ